MAQRRMKTHPVCDILPMMSDGEFTSFVADIRKNGQIEPILLDDRGRIVDGRNRERACRMLGIEPMTRVVNPKGSLASFVLSKNLHRRHLTPSQRAAVGLEMVSYLAKEIRKKEHLRKTGTPERVPEWVSGEASQGAGRMVGVSGRVVRLLMSSESQAPGIKEVEKDGTLRVREALALAVLPKERRDAIIRRVRSGENFKDAKKLVLREARRGERHNLKPQSVLFAL